MHESFLKIMKERELIIEQLQGQIKKFGDQQLLKAGMDQLNHGYDISQSRGNSGQGLYAAQAP